jgi:transposase
MARIIPRSFPIRRQRIIEEKVKPDSIVYNDTLRAYNPLDVSDFHHMGMNHSELFAY